MKKTLATMLFCMLLLCIISCGEVETTASEDSVTDNQTTETTDTTPSIDNSDEYWTQKWSGSYGHYEAPDAELPEGFTAELALASEHETNFYNSLKEANGNCKDASLSDLEYAIEPITRFALEREIAVPRAAKLIRYGIDCIDNPVQKYSIIQAAFDLQYVYPNNTEVRSLFAPLRNSLIVDLKENNFNPNTRYTTGKLFASVDQCSISFLGQHLTALQRLAEIKGNLQEAKQWEVHYADQQLLWHECDGKPSSPSPVVAFNIFQAMEMKQDAERAAAMVGDEVMEAYLIGEWDYESNKMIRYHSLQDDKETAEKWYNLANLNDEEVALRTKALAISPNVKWRLDNLCKDGLIKACDVLKETAVLAQTE